MFHKLNGGLWTGIYFSYLAVVWSLEIFCYIRASSFAGHVSENSCIYMQWVVNQLSEAIVRSFAGVRGARRRMNCWGSAWRSMELWSGVLCQDWQVVRSFQFLTITLTNVMLFMSSILIIYCVNVCSRTEGLNRCRKSCRLRWLNYLSPRIKRGKFEDDEVDLIVRLHKLLGNRWLSPPAKN